MKYFIYWTTDVKSSKLWSSRNYKRNICNCVHRNLNIQDFNGVWTSNPKLAEIEILSTVARGNVKGMWDMRLLSGVVGRTRHPRASSRVIHGFIWYLFIPRTLTNAANGYFYWTRSILYPTTTKVESLSWAEPTWTLPSPKPPFPDEDEPYVWLDSQHCKCPQRKLKLSIVPSSSAL